MPGGPGYELAYSVTGVLPYLLSLAPATTSDESSALDAAWATIADHEQKLLEPLLAFLRSQEGRGVKILGDSMPGASRVPTVSFVVQGEKPLKSKDVVKVFDQKGGVRSLYFSNPAFSG